MRRKKVALARTAWEAVVLEGKVSPTEATTRRKRTNLESTLQTHFFRWLFHRDRDIWRVAHAIPNGGYRSPVEAAKFKQEGVKPGIPDIFIPFASSYYHGLYIEFKIAPNKLSIYQTEMIKFLRERDYAVAVCYSLDEAMDVFNKYREGSYVQQYPVPRENIKTRAR